MRSEKSTTHSLADLTTQAVLIAITLMSASVLWGWHLHIRLLVQIIPGTVPMQYNTALCFGLLGVSSWALITRRGHRLSPAIAGGLVALVGLLNIFEYTTGISLGIDSLLFFPWEQTLSVYPDRMAVTTAISFVSAGGALVLLGWRPGALALFGTAQMLPLTLGVTSVFAYLIGMTLSIFDLGIQMSVNAALAFTGYGIVMFSYAWRSAPRADDGLPKWAPALAIIVAPFFFVGFIVIIHSNSLVDRGVQVLISLLSAGLLALAIHKLTKWKMARKGLILVSVPLLAPVVFVLAIVALSTDIRRNAARTQSLQTKEVITQTQTLVRTLLDAEDGIRGYVITGDVAFAQPYYHAAREATEALSRLQALVHDDPEQQSSMRSVEAKAAEKLELMAELDELMRSGAKDKAVARIRSVSGKHVTDEFRGEIAGFLEYEERLGSARQATTKEMRQRFYWLLIAAGSIDLVLTLMLAFLFSTGISRRISTLVTNARSLSEGKELAPPLTGSDEIASLDRVFHDMANALDEATRKERAVVEAALDVICSTDVEGRFVRVNPASLKVWGYHPAELVGRRHTDLVVQEEVAKTNQVAIEIRSGKTVSDFENRCRHKDGSVVTMMWSASWSETEQLMCAVGRDITERKRAEEQIKQLNEDLEGYAAQLEAANKELEAFSYSVSHDLRAPLRHIHGFTDLLEKSAVSTLDDKGRRYLKTISESAKQMGRLVDDLLAFSRMGRADMQKTRVSLEQLVDEAKRDLQPEIEGRAVSWKNGGLPEVEGDPAMLRLVLTNLISNALKYTRTRPEALIEIGTSNGHPHETVFFVRDNGVGFDMRYVDKLFGVFQRLHRAEDFEGTGIGLANVRRIIHRHGGTTWAEGIVDGGATFYFSLPINSEKAEQ